MAGMAHSVDAAKAMGRGKIEGRSFGTNRAHFRWIDREPRASACFKLDDDDTSLRICCTSEASKRGILNGDLDR
jgi:hypothetical protein